MLHVSVDNCGITVDNKSKKISLDPNKQPNSDFIFVSHAHSDHLYRCVKENGNKIITSKITHKIAMQRGYKYGETNKKKSVYESGNYTQGKNSHNRIYIWRS